MTLDFKKYGAVLGGRNLAEKLRLQIENSEDKIILDFLDVRTVSHSFADELIGKLAEKLGAEAFRNRIKIANLSESNKAVFKYVIAERTTQAA